MNARMRLIATATVSAAVAAILLVPSAASAEAAAVSATVASAPATAKPGPTAPPHMGSYPAHEYAAAAAALPQGLQAAVRRDLGVTPEQYLADADAAADAARVLVALKAAKVTTYGARIDGTTLTVLVPNASSAAEVEATGATAVVTRKPAALSLGKTKLHKASTDVYGGEGYEFAVSSHSGYRCSVGFTGHSSSGTPEFLTAGHCLVGQPTSRSLHVVPDDLTPAEIRAAHLDVSTATIGTPVAGAARFGSHYDASLAKLSASATAFPAVYAWGGSDTSSPASAGAPITIRGSHAVVPGEALCKSGSTSGYTCGTAVNWPGIGGTAAEATLNVEGHTVNEALGTMCIMPGDSGGAVFDGSSALGIVSAGNGVEGATEPSTACTPPCTGNVATDFPGGDFTGCVFGAFFPLVSGFGAQSVTKQYGSKWELGVVVDQPVITPPGGAVTRLSFLYGTLPHPMSTSVVDLRVQGSSTVLATASVDPGDGSWALPLSKAPIGDSVTLTVTGRVGKWSVSTAASAVVEVDALAESSYIGANYPALGGLLASAQSTEAGGTAYLVDTAKWSDVAVAATAAAHGGNALVATTGGSVSAATLAQLRSLAPTRIVAVGSTAASEAAAIANVLPAAPSVTAWTASDAYGLSRLGAAQYGSASTAVIATGRDANDVYALPAFSAENGAPLILVDGKASSVPSSTTALLTQLGVSHVLIVGSTSRVSSKIATQLGKLPGVSVTRVSGSGVADTTRQVALLATSSVSHAVLVPQNQPVAAFLATTLAVGEGASILASGPTCLATTSVDALRQLGVTHTAVVGLTGAITPSVGTPASC